MAGTIALRLSALPAIVLAALGFGAAASVSHAAPGDNETISVNYFDGLAGGDSAWPAISRDGRFVAFVSNNITFTPGDNNASSDVYLRDRATGITERISIGFGGVDANRDSLFAAISGDGRYVLFYSGASNLVPDDTNDRGDLFQRDRLNQTTRRVTYDSDGWLISPFADVSDDGRFIIFQVDQATYIRDLLLGFMQRVLWTPSTTMETRPQISGDGTHYVMGLTEKRALVMGDLVNNSGIWSDGASGRVFAINRDGRWVAYEGWLFDKGGQLWLLDTTTLARRLVSANAAGEPANGSIDGVSVSDDGRYVAFSSNATNLVPDDTNGVADMFIKDMQTGAVEAALPYVLPGMTALSGDGRFVAGASWLAITPNDRNLAPDIYVHERGADSAVWQIYEMYLRPLQVYFGGVAIGQTITKGFTLRNPGPTPLPFRMIELTGVDRSQYVLKSYCGTVVQPGEHCWIAVTFKPTSLGWKKAALHVIGGTVERYRALRGTGVQ